MAIVYYLFYPYVYCASLQQIYSSIFEFVVNMHVENASMLCGAKAMPAAPAAAAAGLSRYLSFENISKNDTCSARPS
jgi:hypothetical protein